MKNHEIPSEIWRLRNLIIDNIEKHMSNSNNEHYQYKQDMSIGARSIKSICDRIEELAKNYVQPKQD